jgi:hypothetical protein
VDEYEHGSLFFYSCKKTNETHIKLIFL